MSPLLLETSRSFYDIPFYVGIPNTYFNIDKELNRIVYDVIERDLRSQHERMLCKQEFVLQIDRCLMKISELINVLDSFPTKYNQILLQGALDYCRLALRKIQANLFHLKAFEDIEKYIKKYILFVENFCSQHQDETENIAKVDLQVAEDYFENIQDICKKANILPLLEEMTLYEYPE